MTSLSVQVDYIEFEGGPSNPPDTPSSNPPDTPSLNPPDGADAVTDSFNRLRILSEATTTLDDSTISEASSSVSTDTTTSLDIREIGRKVSLTLVSLPRYPKSHLLPFCLVIVQTLLRALQVEAQLRRGGHSDDRAFTWEDIARLVGDGLTLAIKPEVLADEILLTQIEKCVVVFRNTQTALCPPFNIGAFTRMFMSQHDVPSIKIAHREMGVELSYSTVARCVKFHDLITEHKAYKFLFVCCVSWRVIWKLLSGNLLKKWFDDLTPEGRKLVCE